MREWIQRRWIMWMWKRQQKKNLYPQTGLYWHVHHDSLCEWCYSYEERVKFIIKYKPLEEVKLRLKLFTPVKGKLPEKAVEELRRADILFVWEINEKYKNDIMPLHKKEHSDCP